MACIQQSIADQAIANGEFTLMHVSKPKESILKTCYDVLFLKMSIICYETYIQLFFVSQLLKF